MNNSLEFARQQVEKLRQLRLHNVLENAHPEFQAVLQLLPLLFHLNYPSLAGFVRNAPNGVSNFELSSYQRQYLEQYLPHVSFENLESFSQQHNENHQSAVSIFGIYVMGSIGSISQTTESDLDVWLCIDPQTSAFGVKNLREKTKIIQRWALKKGIEINFFLMTENYFKGLKLQSFTDKKTLTDDNCGTAQHMLLLDEFYRSAIMLAGKPLLWWHIWLDNEADYEHHIQDLIQSSKIHREDWVDFGGLSSFSASEYFGASLWQLYKGIDSPYKSVLKILLLESYSFDYPHTRLIAQDFKKQLFEDKFERERFDSYLAMLSRVTDYLRQKKDEKRLEFIHQCFFIKATENNTSLSEDNWKFQQLKNIAKQWNWSENFQQLLIHHQQWKIRQVKRLDDKLTQMLILSYRTLLHFGRKHKVNARINPQDLVILSRKLYTAFERLPDKVELFNHQIALDLSENDLTFIETNQSRQVKKGWYVMNQAPHMWELSKYRHIEYSPNLVKLVAWSYFNGLLTANTQVHIASPHISLNKLRAFITDLRLSLPLQWTIESEQEPAIQHKIRDLVVMINFTQDPTENLHKKLTPISHSNLFSFGEEEQNLVGSIELIYRNYWNEIKVLHFEGKKAIFDTLKLLANKTQRDASTPETVNIFCYSHYYQNELKTLVGKLIRKCIQVHPKQNIDGEYEQQILRISGRNWQLFFAERGLNISETTNDNDKIKTQKNDTALLVPQAHHLANTKDYPLEINHFAAEGFLQFFFEDNPDKSFNVYILDEQNHLEIYLNCTGCKEKTVSEVNFIYNAEGQDEHGNHYAILKRDFNYPQFYQIEHQSQDIKILPFRRNLS